ncbi:MAG TPA: hypothetical protein VLA49_19660 [Anaerolineales bacterium]|nr:hypothetical protein [Anaerolineales bacterium]
MIFVILFGGISLTTALGWWQTKTTKEPVKFSEGEAAGQYDPADIRGSYLFGDISRLFEIPLEDLQSAFYLPGEADPAAYAVKSLEEQYAGQELEIGTQSLRLFVALYKGLPFELSEGIYLPDEAVSILKEHVTLTPEQLAYPEAHTLPTGSPEAAEPASQTVEEFSTGKVTLQALVDAAK